MSGNTLFCPKCQVPLEHGNYRNIQIGSCPQCQGSMVRRKDLENLLRESAADLTDEEKDEMKIEPIVPEKHVWMCPGCQKPMDNHGYMETKYAFIDSCINCDVIWIDSDELCVMSVLYFRTQKKIGEISLKCAEEDLRAEKAKADSAERWGRLRDFGKRMRGRFSI